MKSILVRKIRSKINEIKSEDVKSISQGQLAYFLKLTQRKKS